MSGFDFSIIGVNQKLCLGKVLIAHRVSNAKGITRTVLSRA